MPKNNPVFEMRKKRKEQKRIALAQLNDYKVNQIVLKRPVFFVPGWTDEQCKNWIESDGWGRPSMKDWIDRTVENRHLATFIKFSDKETRSCKSFLDFGKILSGKIHSKIGQRKNIDIIGHSMGGLDIVAAVTRKEDPLRNIHNFITVATPHQGSEWGEIGAKFGKSEQHILSQCINLDPDQLPIKMINRLKTRKLLLEKINKLYCFMGTRDMVVMGSAKFNIKGLPKNLVKNKVEFVNEFGGARHSSKEGITRDPRAVLLILKILLGETIDKPKRNYGYIFKRP